MECLVVFFVVLAISIAAGGSLMRRNTAARRRRKGYQRLAARFSGRHQAGGLLNRPAVMLRHGETTAVLRETTSRGPYKSNLTQIQIGLPDARISCDLITRKNADLFRPNRHLSEVACGHEQFQRAVVLRTDRRSDVTALFSDAVCWHVQQLLDTADPRLYLKMHRGKMLIQKGILIRDFEILERFVSVSLGLYDQLMLTRAEGIEFVASDEISTLDKPKCTICGDTIVADMVFCRRCKTPHHGECWHYIGGCSIFACREKHYLRPQTGAPKTSG